MHHPTSALALAGGPTPVSDGIDLEPHLPLVAHVVRQLALRVPAHVDRGAMWRNGALGLAVATRWNGVGPGFGTLALRAIRSHVLQGLREDARAPDVGPLAALLGVEVDVLRSHLDPFLHATVATDHVGKAESPSTAMAGAGADATVAGAPRLAGLRLPTSLRPVHGAVQH